MDHWSVRRDCNGGDSVWMAAIGESRRVTIGSWFSCYHGFAGTAECLGCNGTGDSTQLAQ